MAGRTDFYVVAEVRFSAGDIEAWRETTNVSASPPILRFDLGATAQDYVAMIVPVGVGPWDRWVDTFVNPGTAGGVEPDVWHTVTYHYSLTTGSVGADGNSDTFTGLSDGANNLRVGICRDPSVGIAKAGTLEMRSVRVGSTLGGTNIFSFDALTDSLAKFDTVAGDVSLADGIVTFRASDSFAIAGVPAFPVTAVSLAGDGSVSIAGNHTALFPADAPFVIVGSTGNDSEYSVSSSAFAAGTTTISLQTFSLSDGTADGTVVASAFLVAGDQTATFTGGTSIRVVGSTANDRSYTVLSSSHAAGTTTILVQDTVEDATADGTIWMVDDAAEAALFAGLNPPITPHNADDGPYQFNPVAMESRYHQ